MDSDFVPRLGNDAYGAIRGFVYQVDLTVERWLDLREGERLELERGEDIDHLSRALLEGESGPEDRAAEPHRLLEQVKHLQRPITLRSPSVRAALCNAFEHFRTNQGQRLLFRFTTTATVGREAGSSLPAGISGIGAWEEFRQGNPAGSNADTYQQGIRLLLRVIKPPKGVSAAAWRGFQEFLREGRPEALTAFIQRVEWSVGAPSAEVRSAHVQNRLVEQSRAASPEEARAIYERLFVRVFRLLCQPGLKSLTLSDLERTLTQPTLPAADRQLLRTVATALGEVEARVGFVERALAEYKAALPEVRDQLNILVQQQGIEAAVKYAVATPDLEPPPPLAAGVAREATVDSLWKIVEQHAWTALVGASTTGKTQLALNMVRTRAPKARWLRLRDLSVAQASLRLDSAVEALVGRRAARSLREWYGAMADRVSICQMIVLDDVPRFRTGDEFAARLDALVPACEHAGLRLLTTSAFPLPSSYRELYSNERVTTTEPPTFTEAETRDLLLAYGAPPTLLTGSYLGLVQSLTQDGNPALLQAMARYLSRKGWGAASALNGFVTNAYSAEVNAETVHRLLRTVEDVEARELLYRLNLIRGEFSMKQVRVVAEVAPPVLRPRERLEQLLGLWIQSESLVQFSVSPLMQTLGSEDLPTTTSRACHVALADEIVSRGSINQLEVTRAFSHLIAGGEHNRAALVLLHALAALDDVENDFWTGLLGSIWIDLPLPDEIDLALRLQIRAFQVRLRAKETVATTFLLNDLDALLEKAGERETWSVFSASLIVSSVLVPLNTRRAGSYLRLMQRTLPLLPENVTKMLPEARLDPAPFLWMAAAEVDNQAGLQDWLSNVESLEPARRATAFATDDGDRAAVYVANSFYLAELDKPASERDWGRVLDDMEVLERRGRELGIETIWRAAVCIQISSIGVGLKDLAEATEVAQRVLSESNIAARTRFRVQATLAYAYVDGGGPAEALRWLESAREDNKAAPRSEAIRLLLMLSKVTGAESASEALRFVEEARAIALEAGRMNGDLDAKTFGETAVAHWLNGDLRSAFLAWEPVAERVLENYPGDAEWKKLYVPFTHGAGFFFAVAGHEDPSGLFAARGGYDPPYRGMFLDTTWDLERAPPVPKAYVCVHTAVFAEGVGEYERAFRWARRGLAVVDKGQHAAEGMLIPLTAVEALLDGRFADAFTLSRRAGEVFVSQGKLRSAGADTLAPYNIEEVLGPREHVAWDEVESFALNTGVVPALLRIGRLAVVEPEQFHASLRAAADACRKIAADSTRPELWSKAAEAFIALDVETGFPDLLALGNVANSPSPHAAATMYQLGYLAASLHPGASLTTAIELHLYTARHIQVYLYSHPGLQQVAIPFFFDYWKQRLATARFNFYTPSLVERGIEEASHEPVRNRLAALFRTVANGLRFQIPAQVWAGLRGEAI